MAEVEAEPPSGTEPGPALGNRSGLEREPRPPTPPVTGPADAPVRPSRDGRGPSVAGSLALVAAGGCAGTLVRALLEQAWPAGRGQLPTTTLVINVVGALGLGLLLGVLGERGPRLRLVLGTGVLGGLTTHSTFILESQRLLAPGGPAGHRVLGTAYLLGSMTAGLVAAGVGLWLAGRVCRWRRWRRPAHPGAS